MLRLIFRKAWDKYEPGQNGFVERTLGVRLCDDGYAIPYSVQMQEDKFKAKKQQQMEVATSTVKAERAIIKRHKKAKR